MELMSVECTKVLDLLRSNGERESRNLTTGEVWTSVYLRNAQADSGLSKHEFAGYLSHLASIGLYRIEDQHFGEVRL